MSGVLGRHLFESDLRPDVPPDAGVDFIHRPQIMQREIALRFRFAVLIFGVALLNQALFWLLAVLLQGQERLVAAGRFWWASLGLGAVLWLILVIAHVRVTGGGSRKDLLVVMLTGVLIAAGLVAGSPEELWLLVPR